MAIGYNLAKFGLVPDIIIYHFDLSGETNQSIKMFPQMKKKSSTSSPDWLPSHKFNLIPPFMSVYSVKFDVVKVLGLCFHFKKGITNKNWNIIRYKQNILSKRDKL
jgi:hypothetical protein